MFPGTKENGESGRGEKGLVFLSAFARKKVGGRRKREKEKTTGRGKKKKKRTPLNYC